uniref:HAT C-terminal dimerisation domain-containing protein n=1 Tax=Poecilia formosa TaxID=48698 RepID=A0A087XRL1_POEFO
PFQQWLLANVCLARNTVVQRLEDVSSDVKRQLEAKGVEFNLFSLACNESTDASDNAQLLRGVDDEMNISEELLELQSLKDQTRGTDLFVSVCSAVDNMKLPWNKVVGITTDGAPAMTGERSGLVQKEKIISSDFCISLDKSSICRFVWLVILWCEDLKMFHLMKPMIKAINYIRSKALCHRQFQQFLVDIQAEYGDVVYHNDVRWLSRGSALQRFYSLREFLAKKGQLMPELSDPVWLSDFRFLVDITQHLNALNISIQGQNAVVNIGAFRTKLLLFQRHLSQTQPTTTHFPSLQEIMTCFPQNDISAQIRRYAADISSLAEEFQQRFRDFAAIEKEITIFSAPFSVVPDDAPDDLQLALFELQCDAESRSRHQHLILVDFYRQLDKDRFRKIQTFLSLFGSTYLCEKTFSVMNINKNSMRTRLTDSHLCDILRVKT